MNVFANVLGIAAVITFNASYLFKKRINLIICNAAARILYVLQYILLGAISGAVLDSVALAVSLVYKRAAFFDKKAKLLTVAIANLTIIGLGILTYENALSILPIIAVISETMALISKKEGRIRLLSLFSTPFWFVYNILCGAYGGAVGNVITLITIGFAIVRFDIGKKQREDAA